MAQKKCLICGDDAVYIDTVTVNNDTEEVPLCGDCLRFMQRRGVSAARFVREYLSRKGRVCPSCGCTEDDFARDYMFGCPDCYREMRQTALAEVMKAQGADRHTGRRIR